MHTHKHFSQWVDLLLTHPEKYFKRLKVHYSFKVRYQTETAHFALIHFIYQFMQSIETPINMTIHTTYNVVYIENINALTYFKENVIICCVKEC